MLIISKQYTQCGYKHVPGQKLQFPEMLKPRGYNFGLGLCLITSGLGLETLWPQACGLGLKL